MVFAGAGVSRFRATPGRASRQRERFRSGDELDYRVQLVLAAFRLRAHCVQGGRRPRGFSGPFTFLRLPTRMLTSQHPISRLRAYGNSV